MKKLLIASTALVATASVAAADVAVSGNGRMGIVNDGTDTVFNSRIRIVFTASGETDGGLTFGGSIRADNAIGGAAGTAGSVFLAGESWKATMGDIDGAMEKAVGDLSGVGYVGNGDFNETAYLTGGEDEGLLLEASFSGATIYASAGQREGDDEVALGVSYTFGDWTVGAGYEDEDSASDAHMGLSVAGNVGDLGLKALYTKAGDATQLGLSVDYGFDAATVTAFYKVLDDGSTDADVYGLGVAYDLGGGAKVKAGYVDGDDALVGDARYDLGITMSF
ncbi:porin [Amylibacter marinus]|uniref:Porin n=1 Tax=Amylibacter marinus TaxID=1475483 RepID=A0ABQ5VW12_9RHOB|nr:porin [Amylibacter marinus]GLQ35406.1 porin [Amylibacter marinus]